MRLLEIIQEYDFAIEYWPDAKNYVQDALSRRPDYKEPPIPRLGPKQKRADVPDVGEILLAGGELPHPAHTRRVVRQPVGSDTGSHHEDCSPLAERHLFGRDVRSLKGANRRMKVRKMGRMTWMVRS
jgi:hypothetical protein